MRSWWNAEKTVQRSRSCQVQGRSSTAEHTASMREALDLTPPSATRGKRWFLLPNGVLEIDKIFSYRLILGLRLPPWGRELHLSFFSLERPRSLMSWRENPRIRPLWVGGSEGRCPLYCQVLKTRSLCQILSRFSAWRPQREGGGRSSRLEELLLWVNIYKSFWSTACFILGTDFQNGRFDGTQTTVVNTESSTGRGCFRGSTGITAFGCGCQKQHIHGDKLGTWFL